MKSNRRSIVALLLLTVASVAMLWGVNQRSKDGLRLEVLAQAEQRSMQLADAMAGQVAAELALMNHVLLDARGAWAHAAVGDVAWAEHALEFVPEGQVLSMSLVSAEGRVVYNSAGAGLGLDVSDRSHFRALKSGEDHLEIGIPVTASAGGEWLIPVGRPLYRDGRFAGAIFLLLSADRLADTLRRLALADGDIVVLLDGEGRYLARSVENAFAMDQVLPRDRPFEADSGAVSGHYRQSATLDNVRRVFGWHRLPDNGLVLEVGLAESSILAPLVSSIQRSFWLTGILSAVLLLGWVTVARLLWRNGRSAQAMHESEQLLKDAQRMAKLGHVSQNLRAGTAIWSDEMYRIFGYDIDDPGLDINGARAIYARTHPDDLPSLRANLEASVMGCYAVELIHRIVMPSGAVKYLRVQSVVEGEDGVPVRGNATVQDITEVRVAQLALKEMNEKLEARVEARTRELGELNHELEAFAYSVSHDLRTPLRSIHGFATLLEEESDLLSKEGRSHLRRIQDGARRMGLLITDLLTMAHQSRAVLSIQRLNLSELAEAVVVEIEREDPQRKVVWQIEPGLWAWADPVLMRVVLQNLLGNAWKYTRQVEQAEISFQRVGQTGGMSEYCVRDNGAGFDMAYVEQMFLPFKRLHAHHEFEGSGVGLASVQRLVQRHGGTVRAEGAVGEGAAIYFSLPDGPVASDEAPDGAA